MEAATRLVLVVLADYAGQDGRHAFPAVATIATRLCADRRSVQRSLVKLREDGYIVLGDQRHTMHYPANRRPVVYDLLITERASKPVDNDTDSGVTHAAPVIHRGGVEGTSGAVPTPPKPSTKPNYETTPTPSRLPLVECPACGDTFRDSHECRPHRRHRRPSALTQPEAPARHPLAHRWCDEHYTTRNAAGICAGCRADQIGVPTS